MAPHPPLQSLTTLELVADLSYAWIHIDRFELFLGFIISLKYYFAHTAFLKNFPCVNSYTGFMQEFIKRQPSLVIKLRSTFLKVYTVNSKDL